MAAPTHRPSGTGGTDPSFRAGSQYTSIRYTDTLALEGLQPSIGSVGDAYDNAAAETVMGLFKNEAVAKDSPFRTGAMRTVTDVMEIVTSTGSTGTTTNGCTACSTHHPGGIRTGILRSTNRLATRCRRQQKGGMKTGTVHLTVQHGPDTLLAVGRTSRKEVARFKARKPGATVLAFPP